MAGQEPKFVLIVIAENGIVVRDTPRSQTEGGIRMRAEAVGKQLLAFSIHNIGGVPYARLVPQNPQKPEWVRVAEADGVTRYVDVAPMTADGEAAAATEKLADAINHLAEVLDRK